MNNAWRDLLFNLLLIFFLLINPVGSEERENTKPPGTLIVEARWADGIDCDIDLWVKSPNDGPVGFPRKNGKVFDLLRDDLGSVDDFTGLNYEFAYSRGVIDGDYVINLHMYRCKPPMTVKVTVDLTQDGKAKRISQSEVTLVREKQEVTVSRFTLRDGNATDKHSTFVGLAAGAATP